MSEAKTKRTTIDFPVRAKKLDNNGELTFSKPFLMATRKGMAKPEEDFVVEVLSISAEDFLLKHSRDTLRYHTREFLESLESFMVSKEDHVYMVLEPVEDTPLPSVDELLYS